MSVKSAVATGAVVITLVSATAMADSVRSNLASHEQTINSQIELYTVQHGKVPWPPGEVARTQWRPLVSVGGCGVRACEQCVFVDNRYLQTEPRNPLSPPEVATRIVELTEAGDRGLDLDPAHAGWAWNSTDHLFYGVGLEHWLAEREEAWRKARMKARWSFKPVLMLVGASIAVMVLFFAGRLLIGQVAADVRWQSACCDDGDGGATVMSPWARASSWCGVLAVFMIPAPLSLVVGAIAWADVMQNDRRGLGRALFAVVMGAIFSLLLVVQVIDLWPPN